MQVLAQKCENLLDRVFGGSTRQPHERQVQKGCYSAVLAPTRFFGPNLSEKCFFGPRDDETIPGLQILGHPVERVSRSDCFKGDPRIGGGPSLED